MKRPPGKVQPYQRYKALVRIIRLMRQVEGRQTCNIAALAQQYGVCTRTIRRDLQALHAAGIAVPMTWRQGQQDMTAYVGRDDLGVPVEARA